jgi:hypothetical protein
MEKKHEICIINCYPECFVTALVCGLQEGVNPSITRKTRLPNTARYNQLSLKTAEKSNGLFFMSG